MSVLSLPRDPLALALQALQLPQHLLEALLGLRSVQRWALGVVPCVRGRGRISPLERPECQQPLVPLQGPGARARQLRVGEGLEGLLMLGTGEVFGEDMAKQLKTWRPEMNVGAVEDADGRGHGLDTVAPAPMAPLRPRGIKWSVG